MRKTIFNPQKYKWQNIPRKISTFSSKPITSDANNLARSSAALHSSCAFVYSLLKA